MGEIKSAWELAMERVEKLGKVSTEELRKQEEEKRNTIGQVLADKYLGGLALWQLQIDLDKIAPQERVCIRAVMLSKLVDAIELGNDEGMNRVRDAVCSLNAGQGHTEGFFQEMAEVFESFDSARDKESRSIEAAARELLHQLRISGTAISGVNPRVITEWRSTLDEQARPFRETLDGIKGRLKAMVG